MSRSVLLLCLLLQLVQHAHATSIDLSQALVIGNGPKTVIEFTDPDCSFCRKAAKYFHNRPDVKKYIIFMPLDRHRDAKEKIRYILSHNDAVKAYQEVMAGKLDRVDSKQLPVNTRGIKLQEAHQEIAKKARVTATPTFIIYGRVIEGFDLPEIESVIGKYSE